jgi:hypothetical protein
MAEGVGAGWRRGGDTGPSVDQVRAALRARIKNQQGSHTVHREFSGPTDGSKQAPGKRSTRRKPGSQRAA